MTNTKRRMILFAWLDRIPKLNLNNSASWVNWFMSRAANNWLRWFGEFVPAKSYCSRRARWHHDYGRGNCWTPQGNPRQPAGGIQLAAESNRRVRTTTTTGSALAKDGPRGRGAGNPGWRSFRLFPLIAIICEITKPS